MTKVDFATFDATKKFFRETAPGHRSGLACRASLRVLGNIVQLDNTLHENVPLIVLRANLTAACRSALKDSDFDWKTAVHFAAVNAVEVRSRLSNPAAAAAVLCAADATRSADNSNLASDAVLGSAYSASVAGNKESLPAKLAAIAAAEWDAHLENPLLSNKTVWAGAEPPPNLYVNHMKFITFLEATPDWAFWLKYYKGLWNGTFDEWDLAFEVIKIDEADWEKGYRHIGEQIAEIEARMALRESLQDLRNTDRREIAKVLPPPRGHNNPPEMIEDPQIAGHVEIVWATLDTLENEARSDTPDKSKAKEALLTLKSWFLSACKYIGRKADLAIDTTIKWIIPTAGGGYLITHPEKLAKVIELAANWLKH